MGLSIYTRPLTFQNFYTDDITKFRLHDTSPGSQYRGREGGGGGRGNTIGHGQYHVHPSSSSADQCKCVSRHASASASGAT